MKRAALAFSVCALTAGSFAHAQPKQPAFITVDRVVVRFVSPETGGASRPRFLTQRTLGFEARLLSLAEDGSLDYQERHVHAAIDATVAREMLTDLPLEHEPDAPTLARVGTSLRQSLLSRIGGQGALERAMGAEGMTQADMDERTRREARAAIYVDRAVTPVLYPTESQLRDVFRTTANPYRDRPFEDVREDLARWLVAERVRGAETAFLQTARSRVVVTFAAAE